MGKRLSKTRRGIAPLIFLVITGFLVGGTAVSLVRFKPQIGGSLGSYLGLGRGRFDFANLSEDGIITGDWDNTANPWSDAEVTDDLTIEGGEISNTLITIDPASLTIASTDTIVNYWIID